LYEVAPVTGAHERVTWLLPDTANNPIGGGNITESANVLDVMLFKLAVIFVLPNPIPLRIEVVLAIVPTEVFEEVQLTCLDKSDVELSEYVPVALRTTDLPYGI
jgi:hypothetical protein